ncbi:MAG: hypothetical protein CMP11_05155 [Zetaproteobacteria bacterium]|nr:hypothetical protein [Pseudobdellovibrionaceae bacterium]
MKNILISLLLSNSLAFAAAEQNGEFFNDGALDPKESILSNDYFPFQNILEKIQLTTNDQPFLEFIKEIHNKKISLSQSSGEERMILLEEIDKLEEALYSIDIKILFRLFRYKLENFQYLSQEFFDLYDIVYGKFQISRATTDDLLSFISFKINDDTVSVEKIETFLSNHEYYLNKKTKSIFIYEQKDVHTDPHITAFVLFPGKYIEVLDSIGMNDPSYPTGLIEDIYQKLNLREGNDIGIVEHDCERQTSAGICPYYAIFSAINTDFQPIWKNNLNPQGRTTVPMDAKLMSATGSIKRLEFLEHQAEIIRESGSDLPSFVIGRSAKPVLTTLGKKDFTSAPRDVLSPRTEDFESKYTDFLKGLNGNTESSQLYFFYKNETSLSLASPYIQINPVGKYINTLIDAVKFDFQLFLISRKLD